MATSRPFAYNPIPPGSEISGTTQFVDLAIGVLDEQYDEDYGGIKWWEGPDEDLGYIICQPIPPNTQPTPISGLTASVGFYRTTAFTDSAFLNLCNALPARKNQTKFQTTNEAIIWLTANGYWTNYVAPTPTPTATVTPTPTGDPYYYYVSNQYICPDCNTIIGLNTTIKSLIPISNNYWVPGAGDSQFQVLSGTSPYYMATTVNGADATLTCGCLSPTPTPTMTPSQTPGIYYYEVFTLDENCNTTSSFIGYNSTYVLTFNYFLIDGTNYFVMPWATYDPSAILLGPFTSSTCIAVTPTSTPTNTPTPTPTPTPSPTSGYTVTLSSCNTGNATYALGGSFVNGDIVEVKATFSGTGNAGVNNSNASLFLGTTGVATGSTCFTPTTFMSWNLSLTGTLTFSGGTTVFVRSLAENAAAASVNASTSLEITKINGITVTGLSAVGCWDYSTGSPCTP